MIKLFTYIGELVIRNIDRTALNHCYYKGVVNNGWIGAKKNKKGLYDIYYYKKFPKKSATKHNYLRNLENEY